MKAYLISLSFLLIFQCSFAQKTVYFPGFELINMDSAAGLQYSTSKLLKSYIEDNHNYTIILNEHLGNPNYTARELLAESARVAAEKGTRYVMQGEIHYLQGVYIISLGVYESADHTQVWHDMAKGSVEQDLDPLLSRLGRAFFTSRTAKTDIEIDEVTEYDQQGVELAQIKVNHFVGVMLGGKHIPNQSTLSGFGLAYTYDASTVLFNFDFELYPTSTLSIDHHSSDRRLQTGNIGLGVTYPLTRKRMTFYVQGGMEYGFTSIRDKSYDLPYAETESGIGAYLGGGFLINRNSTVNLRMFTTLSIPFYQVDGSNVTGIKFGIVTSFAKKR
ncbi:hypothetical protein [Ekhidna sp.]|uniref:hypothetical protein n=1 Tax=Ekhidna sp. TaxID=2608089 RepID=UPI003516E232